MRWFFSALLTFWTGATLSAEHTQFQDFVDALNSLSAKFTQHTYDANNALIASTSGTLLFNRPRQLRWTIEHPSEQILLLNHDKLWFVDVELEQASLQSADSLTQTPLYWLLNASQKNRPVPTFAYHKHGIDWYRDTQNTDEYRHLMFAFEGKQLAGISLMNRLDQRLVVKFTQLEVNPRIAPEAFELNLSDAFDIIQ